MIYYLYRFTLWPDYLRVSVMLCISAVIGVLGYGLVLQAQWQQIAIKQQDALRSVEQITVQNTAIDSLSAQNIRLQGLEEDWQHLRSTWMRAAQINTLVGEVERAAHVLGLALIDLHVQAPQVFMTHTLYLLEVRAHSDYAQLLNFLNTLSEKPYFLLNDVQIKKTENARVSAQLVIHILLSNNDA